MLLLLLWLGKPNETESVEALMSLNVAQLESQPDQVVTNLPTSLTANGIFGCDAILAELYIESDLNYSCRSY